MATSFEIQEGFLFARGGGRSLPFRAEMQGEEVGEHGGHAGGCQSVTCRERPSSGSADRDREGPFLLRVGDATCVDAAQQVTGTVPPAGSVTVI